MKRNLEIISLQTEHKRNWEQIYWLLKERRVPSDANLNFKATAES